MSPVSLWPDRRPALAAPPRLECVSRRLPGRRYFLYVPSGHDRREALRLLVIIHGYRRHVEAYARQFTAFADEHHTAILAPIFPHPERFQQLGIGDDQVRADLCLLDLVDEVGSLYRIETGAFDLFGFSAGAQFAHRFMYLHPERIRSVVVASPGTVTLPTEGYGWPSGVANLSGLASARVDLERIRRVRALLIVGEHDIGDRNLNQHETANHFGRTRLDRLRTLHAAWQAANIGHEYVEVAGLAHVMDERIAGRARDFLARGAGA